MKHPLILLFLLFSVLSFSQTPPMRINYQGVARSATGNPFINQAIGVKFRILQGSAAGTQTFTETQSLSTNALGLFNSQIGAVNSLAGIDWANGPYFLEVAIDTTGSAGFIVLGTQQLVSVPYSFYAGTAGSASYAATAGSAPSPTLAITNTSVLTVGTNTVALPVANTVTTSITTSGVIGSTLTGNTYALNVQTPVLTPTLTYGPAPSQTIGGLAQVMGSYPNFTILVAPVIGYDPNVGILSFTSAPFTTPVYDYTYNITPNLGIMNNNILYLGPQSNSVTLPGTAATANASVISTGAATTATLGPNSYSINVPTTSITSTNGSAIITSPGTNTFNISIPSAASPSITGTGAAAVTPLSGPSFTVNVPLTSVVSANSNATVNATGTNSFSILALPPANVVSANSNATVNATGTNSFSILALPPTNVVSANSNATVNATGTNSFSILALPPTNVVSANGNATVTATGTNSFSINVPPVMPATGLISSNNTATVTATGTNSFDLSVPAAVTLSATNGASILGAYPNFTVDAPQQVSLSATAGGGATLTGTYPNYTVNAPQQVNITSGGAITVGGTYPNKTISTPSVTLTGGTTILGTPVPSGLAQVMGSYPNYSIIVTPTIAYTQATGLLSLQSLPFTSPVYSYTYNITPALTKTNNIVQAGPSTNTIAIITPATQVFTGLNGLALAVGTTYTQLNAGTMNFTKQSATSEIDIYLHCEATTGVFLGSRLNFQIRVDGVASVVSSEHFINSGTEFITLRSVFQGLSVGPHTVTIWGQTASGIAALVQLDPNAYGGKLILKETY